MASSSRGMRQGSSCWMLLLVHGLLALTVLHMHSLKAVGVEALPITSRPIEDDAQKDAWETWLRLPYEQKSLEKQKKVMPKSIFALPFRHCPPGHKLYNERCISQTNIDPTVLVAQELQEQLGNGGGGPTAFTDYDYSDNESDELVYEMPLEPLIPLDPLPTSASGAEDQALPSEDAPLKFNIFEKKFPTAWESDANTTTAATPSIATAIATATTTPTPTIATMREDALQAQQRPNNRIAESDQDLQADASVALPSTTSLSPSSSSSSSSSSNIGSFSDIGHIDAIVVPAGASVDAEPTVQLVTSSMRTEPKAKEEPMPNADAVSSAGAQLESQAESTAESESESESEAEAEADAEAEAEIETDLEQLLKVDAFLPAYGSSVDTMPSFSHRRVSPLLSADLDVDDSATDIVPTTAERDADTTTATSTTTTTTTTAAATSASLATPTTPTLSATRAQEQEPELDIPVLKKSKVQPVQLGSTTTTTTTAATATATATTTTISLTSTTPTTTAATSAESSSSAAAAAAAAATTTTAATVAAATETKVAAIHQDANGNARDDDRFYYQHFNRNVAASGSSNSDSSGSDSSSSNSNADSDLDVLNDMASSDNLMTNTIGGQGDSERAASEINFEQEMRIINELVKDKRRLSQLRQQQHEQQQQPSTTTTTTTTTAATIIESGSDASSTSVAGEVTNFWSSLMPMLGQTSTDTTTTITATAATATATAATEQTAETIATTVIAGNAAADSSISTTTAATATATATATVVADTTRSTQQLSINANRSNRNSKIIRVDSLGASPEPTAATTTAATTTVATTTVATQNDDNYTPFWWLPNIGWRVDRQVDEKGEDRSLLLRIFRSFRASDSNTAAIITPATLASRR